jgi:hypothetical protein
MKTGHTGMQISTGHSMLLTKITMDRKRSATAVIPVISGQKATRNTITGKIKRTAGTDKHSHYRQAQIFSIERKTGRFDSGDPYSGKQDM